MYICNSTKKANKFKINNEQVATDTVAIMRSSRNKNQGRF